MTNDFYVFDGIDVNVVRSHASRLSRGDGRWQKPIGSVIHFHRKSEECSLLKNDYLNDHEIYTPEGKQHD